MIPQQFTIGVFNSAPGGFIVFGCLAAIVQGSKAAYTRRKEKKQKETVKEVAKDE
ncbi:MAG: hypothetical protein K2M99_04260 [Treponemataceae bacterium]|nr:hypothetical protein [Treponemataceae bacterium]